MEELFSIFNSLRIQLNSEIMELINEEISHNWENIIDWECYISVLGIFGNQIEEGQDIFDLMLEEGEDSTLVLTTKALRRLRDKFGLKFTDRELDLITAMSNIDNSWSIHKGITPDQFQRMLSQGNLF